MKLKAHLDDKQYDVEIRRTDVLIRAIIDGRTHEVVVDHPAPDVILIKNENRVYETRISGGSRWGEAVEINLRNRNYVVAISDPKRLSHNDAAGGQHHGAAEITAPMPGKVVRLLVEAGGHVEAGDGILVVEAMKMQNEMKTPRAGSVSQIRVTVGDTVNAGDVLAVVE